MASLESLPDNVLVYSILPELPYEELISLCQTNRRFASLCQDERIWEKRVKTEFPGGIKSPNQSWRNYYLFLKSLPLIPVYLNGDRIMKIPLYKNNLNVDDLTSTMSVLYFDRNYSLVTRLDPPFYNINNPVNPRVIKFISLIPSTQATSRYDLNNIVSPTSRLPIYFIRGRLVNYKNLSQGDDLPIGFKCQMIRKEALDEIVRDINTYLGLPIIRFDSIDKSDLCHDIRRQLSLIGHVFD